MHSGHPCTASSSGFPVCSANPLLLYLWDGQHRPHACGKLFITCPSDSRSTALVTWCWNVLDISNPSFTNAFYLLLQLLHGRSLI